MTKGQKKLDSKSVTRRTVRALVALHGRDLKEDIARGVHFALKVWPRGEEEFITFCISHYVPPGKARNEYTVIVDEYVEALLGNFGVMNKRLRHGTDINDRPLLPIDTLFGGFSPDSHVSDDLFESTLAAAIQLSFGTDDVSPPTSRVGWAMRRLSRVGRVRIPAQRIAEWSRAQSEVDVFISNYNLSLDTIRFPDRAVSFPKGTFLKSHWGLRDYMTSLRKAPGGLPKQRAIRDLMRRVVDGEVPSRVLNSTTVQWDIAAQVLNEKGRKQPAEGEGPRRWEKFRAVFDARTKIDPFTIHGNLIDTTFKENREMEEREVVAMLREALSSPLAVRAGKVIEKMIGRPLEAHDIYLSDFSHPKDSRRQRGKAAEKLFPNARALEQAIPNILRRLGWSRTRAEWIASKIRVHNGRSAGHASAPATREDVQYLRVPAVPGKITALSVETFMHELGHAVEQVLSCYEMDYRCLAGVPNTACTEAFAFTFQEKTNLILQRGTPSDADTDTLARYMELFEIAGPSLVEIEFFHWLYRNPRASAGMMQREIRSIADKVWAKYYARVFGKEGFGLLAVYSHVLWCSFYLADYFLGYVIAYQVRCYLRGKNLSREMERMCATGALYPHEWMKAAVGSPVSLDPLLRDLEGALNRLERRQR